MFIISSDLKLAKKIDLIIVKLIKVRALIILFANKEDTVHRF